MISVSQKIKVAVSHLLRTQMELDIEDYGLKGFGDLCNRILAHYADFPEPNATVNEDILYKTGRSVTVFLKPFWRKLCKFCKQSKYRHGRSLSPLL